MKTLFRAIPAILLTNLMVLPADALTIYSDRWTFERDAPGLTDQGFDGGLIEPGDFIVCSDVIDSATDDDCFRPEDIEPGISFSFVGAASNGMIGVGAFGFFPSAAIGPNEFADDLLITLSVVGGANAIGFDIRSGIGAGVLDVVAFDSGGSTLGVATLRLSAGERPEFVGFIADEPISRLLFNDLGKEIGELIDDVAFGNTLSVPAPPTLALLGLGLLGVGYRRRQRVTG